MNRPRLRFTVRRMLVVVAAAGFVFSELALGLHGRSTAARQKAEMYEARERMWQHRSSNGRYVDRCGLVIDPITSGKIADTYGRRKRAHLRVALSPWLFTPRDLE